MKGNNGEYGGVVIRDFKANDKPYLRGAVLTPEEVATWPLSNRMALHGAGKVDWYGPPSPAENDVRKAGAEKVAEKVDKTAKKETAKVAPKDGEKAKADAPKPQSRRGRAAPK